MESALRHLNAPISRGGKLLGIWKELDAVVSECSVAGWDGYDAKPISTAAINEARILLKSMPDTIMPPEIAPEPSGDIGFQWRNAANQILVVGIDGSSLLNFAANLGGGFTNYGTERHSGNLPRHLQKVLLDFFQKDTP